MLGRCAVGAPEVRREQRRAPLKCRCALVLAASQVGGGGGGGCRIGRRRRDAIGLEISIDVLVGANASLRNQTAVAALAVRFRRSATSAANTNKSSAI